MPTTLNRISDVEFELEIEAASDDLVADLDDAVRKQRGRTQLKGFRPGKVPASLVRKLYGKALAYGVAEEHVQKTYQSTVLDDDAYDVLGQPTITELEYEYGGDLKAKVRFGVRPVFELAGLDGVTLPRLVHTATDHEVDHELEHIREREAEMIPAEGKATPESYLLTDIQQVDAESGAPIIGERREDVAFFLGAEDLPEKTRKTMIGMEVGQTSRVMLIRAAEDGEAEGEETPFEVTVKEIKRRILPELDDALAAKVSKGQTETLEAFRDELHTQMQGSIDRSSREMFESEVIRSVLERHVFDVPESVVEMYLDAQVKDLKAQAGDRLPENFDESGYRERNRDEAANQARWMFVRDRIIAEEGYSIEDADRTAYFEKTASTDGLAPEMLIQYYRSVPRLMSQLDERLLTEKVIDYFTGQANVVDKDRETFAREAESSDAA